MNTTKQNIMLPMVIMVTFLLAALPVNAESIEETVDVIQKLAGGNFRFDQSSCTATTRRTMHTNWFDYHVPLKKVGPTPDNVRTHLECVQLYINGYQKEIKRVEKNGDVEMKDKVDICTASRASAEKMAGAIRYLISLCGGPPCDDCDPNTWK